MKNFIIKLRKDNKLSQAKLSEKIGISRPTLNAIEKGKRDITLSELKKFSEIFDIPVGIILDQVRTVDTKNDFQNFSKESFKRFHNLILQCIKYGADDDGNITKTKLAILVYLCDFAIYYNFLKPVSGFEYKRLTQVPVAIEFFDIIDNNESISVGKKDKEMMVSLVEQPDDSILSKKEIVLLKKICKKWKSTNTQVIVDFLHNHLPWSMCKYRATIPYELINMETIENLY